MNTDPRLQKVYAQRELEKQGKRIEDYPWPGDGSYSLPVSDRSLVYMGTDDAKGWLEKQDCSHCCGECQAQRKEFERYEKEQA